jgi:two-component sensor histidine kinase
VNCRLSRNLVVMADLATIPGKAEKAGLISAPDCARSNCFCPVSRLREALAREEILLREKDDLIRQQKIMAEESDHRLLNGLQLVASLLSLQSRAAADPGIAKQLVTAANRVGIVARIHRRLHCLEGTKTVAFKRYLQDLCFDFSGILPSEGGSERTIVVEGIEIDLPTSIAIPLAFAVSELLTNAAKYGASAISLDLKKDPDGRCALCVSNDGPSLPAGFDPAACKGLGMKIVRSLVQQIGGELQFGRGVEDRGARFTVLFSESPLAAQTAIVH